MKIEGEVHAELARHAENARQIQVSSLWSAADMHVMSQYCSSSLEVQHCWTL
jgi:hypothetical protein